MVNTSIKVKQNARFKRADGKSALYLQVIINRKRYDAPINLGWPPEKFSLEDPYCKKRSKTDTEYNDYNTIIRNCVTKANEIIIFYRLSGVELTIKKFKEEYNNQNIKRDFIKYFEFRLNQRYKKKEIGKRTYQSHCTTLMRLKEVHSTLRFADITNDFPLSIDTYLRNQYKNNANTIHGRQKTIKYYMNKAIKENIFFTNPYKNYHLSKMKGNWVSLTRKELKILYKFYNNLDKNCPKKVVLRRFMFSCFTGLRLSDMKALSNAHITDDYVVIKVFKTRKKGRVLHLPLSDNAKLLLNEEKEYGEYSKLFNRTSDQHSNRSLKAIGDKLKLRIPLHHHIGRETFATLYLESGGKIEVLQKYMDHSDIQTTMKYVHISEERKLDEINMIDNMI